MCTLNEIVVSELNEKIGKGEILSAWRQAKEVLDSGKNLEMRLRKELVDKSFTDSKTGKNTVDVDGGKLVYTKGYSTSVDEELFAIVAAECEKHFIAVGSLVKVSHSLNAKNYKALSNEDKAIVDKMLIVKEKAPTLEFVAKAED